jgi:hypothetical protein
VAGGDILEVLRMIQHAKDQIPSRHHAELRKDKQREDLDKLFIVT